MRLRLCGRVASALVVGACAGEVLAQTPDALAPLPGAPVRCDALGGVERRGAFGGRVLFVGNVVLQSALTVRRELFKASALCRACSGDARRDAPRCPGSGLRHRSRSTSGRTG